MQFASYRINLENARKNTCSSNDSAIKLCMFAVKDTSVFNVFKRMREKVICAVHQNNDRQCVLQIHVSLVSHINLVLGLPGNGPVLSGQKKC